jgi:hypothetical protein
MFPSVELLACPDGRYQISIHGILKCMKVTSIGLSPGISAGRSFAWKGAFGLGQQDWAKVRSVRAEGTFRVKHDPGGCGYASAVAGEPALSVEPDRPGAEVAKCR